MVLFPRLFPRFILFPRFGFQFALMPVSVRTRRLGRGQLRNFRSLSCDTHPRVISAGVGVMARLAGASCAPDLGGGRSRACTWGQRARCTRVHFAIGLGRVRGGFRFGWGAAFAPHGKVGALCVMSSRWTPPTGSRACVMAGQQVRQVVAPVQPWAWPWAMGSGISSPKNLGK